MLHMPRVLTSVIGPTRTTRSVRFPRRYRINIRNERAFVYDGSVENDPFRPFADISCCSGGTGFAPPSKMSN